MTSLTSTYTHNSQTKRCCIHFDFSDSNRGWGTPTSSFTTAPPNQSPQKIGNESAERHCTISLIDNYVQLCKEECPKEDTGPQIGKRGGGRKKGRGPGDLPDSRENTTGGDKKCAMGMRRYRDRGWNVPIRKGDQLCRQPPHI